MSHVGQQVTLCGWVNRRRDLGSLIFIDMRDREGIVQVFFDPDRADALKLASELRNEFCIQVTGTVRARDEKNINRDMATGEIEVLASSLTIINRADVLPLDSNHVNTEEARLKYRYLDLRRPEMAQRLKTRAKITSLVRRFMDDHGCFAIARCTPPAAAALGPYGGVEKSESPLRGEYKGYFWEEGAYNKGNQCVGSEGLC